MFSDALQCEIRQRFGKDAYSGIELRAHEQRVSEEPVSDLVIREASIPAVSPEVIERIERYEEKARTFPQIDLVTEHVFHAGMYARTIKVAAGVMFTSVLIKIPTIVIIQGACKVWNGEWLEISGYNVIPASAGRKMIYVTQSPVQITMLFPSEAKSVEEAELEFTDESELLLSRQTENVVTGASCQA